VISLWRRIYGKSPLHLLGQLAAFAITIYAIRQIIAVSSTDRVNLFVWFVAGVVLHDAVFIPVYLGLDRIAGRAHHARPPRNVRVINHVRFPLVICGAMLLMLFPLILGKSEGAFTRASNEALPDYLGRWLLICAVVFGVSALAYAVRLRLDAGRPTTPRRHLSSQA